MSCVLIAILVGLGLFAGLIAFVLWAMCNFPPLYLWR